MIHHALVSLKKILDGVIINSAYVKNIKEERNVWYKYPFNRWIKSSQFVSKKIQNFRFSMHRRGILL